MTCFSLMAMTSSPCSAALSHSVMTNLAPWLIACSIYWRPSCWWPIIAQKISPSTINRLSLCRLPLKPVKLTLDGIAISNSAKALMIFCVAGLSIMFSCNDFLLRVCWLNDLISCLFFLRIWSDIKHTQRAFHHT